MPMLTPCSPVLCYSSLLLLDGTCWGASLHVHGFMGLLCVQTPLFVVCMFESRAVSVFITKKNVESLITRTALAEHVDSRHQKRKTCSTCNRSENPSTLKSVRHASRSGKTEGLTRRLQLQFHGVALRDTWHAGKCIPTAELWAKRVLASLRRGS